MYRNKDGNGTGSMPFEDVGDCRPGMSPFFSTWRHVSRHFFTPFAAIAARRTERVYHTGGDFFFFFFFFTWERWPSP